MGERLGVGWGWREIPRQGRTGCLIMHPPLAHLSTGPPAPLSAYFNSSFTLASMASVQIW